MDRAASESSASARLAGEQRVAECGRFWAALQDELERAVREGARRFAGWELADGPGVKAAAELSASCTS